MKIESYNLNTENYEHSRYFDNEGFDPFGISVLINRLMKRQKKDKPNISITVGHLQNWINNGYWDEIL